MPEVTYLTRTNDGQIKDHQNNIQEAFASFLSLDGYRLDILLSNEKIIYIHRDHFSQEALPESKKNHPAFTSYLISDARVMYYDSSAKLDSPTTTNVIKVNFGDHRHDSNA